MIKKKGIEIKKLPVYNKKINGMDSISRIMKDKGELATICIDTINYISYVEFPIDGEPRANHYHKFKDEFLYLIKGRLKLFLKKGGEKSTIEEFIIEEGTLINIKAGYTHAYITLKKGYAIEFSPTIYEKIKNDKIREIIVKK